MAGTPGIGDLAPDFELEGTDGPFRLSEHRGAPVVLLFYPGDFTLVCTRQFCSYAENSDEMARLDATVVGISPQDVDSHEEFRAAHDIPVPLLADTDKAVAKLYGASAPVLGTRRAVVIIDADGRIAVRDSGGIGLKYWSTADIAAALAKLPVRR